MPTEEHIALTDKERQAVQAVADERCISLQDAVQQLAREALERRVRRGTGRAPARVYEMTRKGSAR